MFDVFDVVRFWSHPRQEEMHAHFETKADVDSVDTMYTCTRAGSVSCPWSLFEGTGEEGEACAIL